MIIAIAFTVVLNILGTFNPYIMEEANLLIESIDFETVLLDVMPEFFALCRSPSY